MGLDEEAWWDNADGRRGAAARTAEAGDDGRVERVSMSVVPCMGE
jgi:hypothetical protein